MRRPLLFLCSLVLLGALAATSGQDVRSANAAGSPGVRTTLRRTIVGGEGRRELQYGPGSPRVTRRLRWTGPGGRIRPLAAFKHLSDIHVLDEESPARVEFFDECSTPFTGAYRPQDALTTQIGNSMLKRLRRIRRGPVTGRRLQFAISTGDNVDNNQLNELRWFIRLLDGRRVHPNSGDPDQGGKRYHGYSREHFDGALSKENLRRAQKAFDSIGTRIPWYAVLGNHDGLAQGNAPSNPTFEAVATGGIKPFTSIDAFADCPDGPEDSDGIQSAFENLVNTRGEPVPPDQSRHFLSHQELVKEFFNSPRRPKGHGLANAPKDPVHDSRAGYYSFRISKRVRGISLDTISYDGGPNGHIPDPQFQWLERRLQRFSKRYYEGGELKKNRDGRNKLVMIFSHHSSTTLNNPGANPEGFPYHCFRETDQPECADGEGLKTLLQRFPNVIAWVNGHEHNNEVRRFPAHGLEASRAFWEINTAAHIDWPQQSRLVEVGWKPGRTRKAADSVIIYGTTVDHAAPLKPNRKKQTRVEYLASLGRVEAYVDACKREGQAECDAAGTKRDRNVKLVQKAPFNLGRR
ncbi:MAG: TIGR03767 family metallophosphoesterase [Actinomycetota bacterium]|nr:TIGR03767 family metallophosphoesterase [Actinomycetota bacterium]